jgi:hypothetical protein
MGNTDDTDWMEGHGFLKGLLVIHQSDSSGDAGWQIIYTNL